MNFSSHAMSSATCMTSAIIVLSEELRAAHRGASYHAATPKAMPLKVDVHSTDLVQLMRKRFAQTAALITGHNPASKKQTPAKNKKANAALQARIEALSLGWLPGHRKAFKDGDPVEDGFLVFGITGGQLEALMVEFDQEVALWCPSSGTPVLMLHPLARRNYSAADIAWEKAMKEAGRSAFVRPTPVKEDAPVVSTTPKGKSKAREGVKTRAKKEQAIEAPVAPVVEPAATPPAKPAASKRAAALAPVTAPVTTAVTAPAAALEVEPVPVRKTRAKRQAVAEPNEPASVPAPPAPAPVTADVVTEKPVRKARVAKVVPVIETAPAPVVEVAPAVPVKPAKLPRKPKIEAPAVAPEVVIQAVEPAVAPVVKTSRKKSAKV